MSAEGDVHRLLDFLFLRPVPEDLGGDRGRVGGRGELERAVTGFAVNRSE